MNDDAGVPALGPIPSGPLVLAVSGGLDSMVLLHLLRFHHRSGGELRVAHMDHGMRTGSAADRDWVKGVCRAWDVPCVTRSADPVPGSEAAAREARYAFLRSVQAELGAAAVLTAHHADDQAETVLFRILRGTGLRGLRGMGPTRDGIVRPLLGCWRKDLERYAAARGVPFRRDPTNLALEYRRNRIRHRILPYLENEGWPRVRRALVRLGANAARAEAELHALEAVAFQGVLEAPRAGRLTWADDPFRTWPRPARRRLVRVAALRLNVPLGATATRLAMEFITRDPAGGGIDLGGGLRLERGLQRWSLTAGSPPEIPDPLTVGVGFRGPTTWGVEGAAYRVSRGVAGGADTVAVAAERFPLRMRAWQPGDRIRMDYGSKAVAKLLAEAGVDAMDRALHPVVVDAAGVVLWVPGVARSAGDEAAAGRDVIFIRCTRTVHEPSE